FPHAGKWRPQPARDRAHLFLRLIDRHSLFEPTDHCQAKFSALAQLLRRESQRQPYIGRRRKLKSWRHHPNDRVALLIERQRLSNQIWVRAESPPPQAMADDRDIGVIGVALFGRENAPGPKADAKQLKVTV